MVRLALDTGSTSTLINSSILERLGYLKQQATKHVGITTASQMLYAPLFEIRQLSVLGIDRKTFAVVSHDLPKSATIDGVVGLDFLRQCKVEIDFSEGSVSLERMI